MPIGVDIELAIQLLREGKLVAIPTETVYGLAANGLDENAVTSIYKAKNRPFFDPLILHCATIQMVERITSRITEDARKLAETFWPGPLTLLLPKANEVPYLVTSGSYFVAVRIPKHPLTLSILKELDFPLAAPSANPFKYISPTKAIHVAQQLGNQVDYILDGGECSVGIESTIVDCNQEQPIILRLGGLKIDDIEMCLGKKVLLQTQENSNPKAPGQMDKHYAPITPIYLVDNIETYLKENYNLNIGALTFGATKIDSPNTINLSASGNLDEAARQLFSSLRKLDDQKYNRIIVQLLPNEGLGIAINDRLKRAAAKE